MSGQARKIMMSAGGAATGSVFLDGNLLTQDTYIFHTGFSPRQLQAVDGDVSVRLHLWGAAGGNGSYGTNGSSGAGGYVSGTITLLRNITYYLYVGQGGLGPSNKSYGVGGDGGWPNGGYGTSGDATGAGGGGMSMLSTALFSTSLPTSSIYMIAGGGGGSTGYSGAAGAGGGSSGQNNDDNDSTGGTQSSGGTYNGSYLQGGNATGSQSSGSDDGGGGGGGYYGGGGGTSDAKPGSGGSGFINTSYVTFSQNMAGSYASAPDPEGLLLGGYVSGKNDITNTPQNGQDGLAYITFN